MKNRKIRTMVIALTLSALSAVLALVLYSLPDETLSFANRVQDYVVHNEALFRFEDNGVFKRLHISTVDVDTENTNLRLVKIDDNSIAEPSAGGLGQFPWPRATHGKLIERLAKAGAKVVAFDVEFLENSHVKGDDEAFARGMHTMPVVLSYQINQIAEIPVAPKIKAAAKRTGFVTVDTPGGWLLYQYLTTRNELSDEKTGKFLRYLDRTSMAASAVEEFTGTRVKLVDTPDHLGDPWKTTLGGKTVPLDGKGHFLMLPFKPVETGELHKREGATNTNLSFAQSISYAQIVGPHALNDADLKEFANGKLVVVGPTAGGLGDFILTPEGRFPGVFSNLRFMDQLLTRKFISRVPPQLDIFLILTLPILIGFLMTRLSAITGIALSLGLILVFSLVSIFLYATDLKWLNLLHVDGGMFLSALAVALYRVFTEGADKRQIRDLFGKHVSPEIVSEMMNSDDPTGALSLKGKRAKVTVFYSDIRGFTAMSEKMTPEQIYNQLNEYFEDMCAIIFQYGGYVDKFIGDCVMAVFSAPNPRPDDAKRAVISAIRQQQKIAEISAAWEKEGKQIFTVGMGLNTGEVVMGNLGSSDRMNYTVIGDNVNTAARLYNVAEGGQTIISESTYEEVKDEVIVNELQPIMVKGKELPLRVFEIVGLKDELPPGTESKMWTGSQEAVWSGKH